MTHDKTTSERNKIKKERRKEGKYTCLPRNEKSMVVAINQPIEGGRKEKPKQANKKKNSQTVQQKTITASRHKITNKNQATKKKRAKKYLMLVPPFLAHVVATVIAAGSLPSCPLSLIISQFRIQQQLFFPSGVAVDCNSTLSCRGRGASVFGSFWAMAVKTSFTFTPVFADVSINSRLFSSA